jgi:hypothetical protein
LHEPYSAISEPGQNVLFKVPLRVGPFFPSHRSNNREFVEREIPARWLFDKSEKNGDRFHSETIGHYWEKVLVDHWICHEVALGVSRLSLRLSSWFTKGALATKMLLR